MTPQTVAWHERSGRGQQYSQSQQQQSTPQHSNTAQPSTTAGSPPLHSLVQQHPVELLQLDARQDAADVDDVRLTQWARRTHLNILHGSHMTDRQAGRGRQAGGQAGAGKGRQAGVDAQAPTAQPRQLQHSSPCTQRRLRSSPPAIRGLLLLLLLLLLTGFSLSASHSRALIWSPTDVSSRSSGSRPLAWPAVRAAITSPTVIG